jgi:hypothetical protein
MCLHYYNLLQAAVEASNSLPAVKWRDLMQPKLFRPLIVSGSFSYYCCLLIISILFLWADWKGDQCSMLSCFFPKIYLLSLFKLLWESYSIIKPADKFSECSESLSQHWSFLLHHHVLLPFQGCSTCPVLCFQKALTVKDFCLVLSAFGIFVMIISRAS